MKCKVSWCENDLRAKKGYGRGYCHACYERWRRNGQAEEKFRVNHGLFNHPFYTTWKGMKDRCYSLKTNGYERYGGRGIKVCDRWLDPRTGLKNFIKDMGERPEGYTLDRVDNNGDYEPANCRWASRVQQAQNQRLNPRNTTGYRGIDFNKATKKYRASKQVAGVRKYLGSYETLNEAVAVLSSCSDDYDNYAQDKENW